MYLNFSNKQSIISFLMLSGFLFISIDCNLFCQSDEIIHIKKIEIPESDNILDHFLELRTNTLFWTKRESIGDSKDIAYYSQVEIRDSIIKILNPSKFYIKNLPYTPHSIGNTKTSLDGNKLVFTYTVFTPSDSIWYLAIAKKEGEDYEFITNVDSTEFWLAHPSISLNDSLIFYSKIESKDKKDADIYFVKRLSKIRFSKPQRLSIRINTEFYEISPFICDYGDSLILYFSSNRDNNSKGYDLYYSYLNRSAEPYSYPVNLETLNSASNDVFYSIPFGKLAEKTCFFTISDSLESTIYQALPNPKPPRYVIVKGTVIEKVGRKISIVNNADVFFKDNQGSIIIQKKTNEEGEIYSYFPLNQKITIQARTNTGLTKDTILFVSSDTLKEIKEIDIDFVFMEKKEILQDTVLFEYDKAELKDTPKIQELINRIIRHLDEDPNNEIEIIGHASYEGSDEYNLDLSIRRAKALYDRLKETIANTKQIEYIGKGKKEHLPGLGNCIGEECAPNRRIEIFYR